MSNKETLEDCLLRINDKKGRVNIPKFIREELNLEQGSLVELDYQALEDSAKKSLLPFKERNYVGKQNRYQTTQNTRDYLGLKQGDYFKAHITKIE